MGAATFVTRAKGKTATEAFHNAVSQAQYDHGHAGYSGTIAEKNSFVQIPLPPGRDPREYAWELIEKNDKRIDDKWGPAGYFKTGEDEFMFFGWASE